MLKTLLKIFLHVLTTLVVLVAILITIARVGSLFAPNYIDNLNQRFAEHGVEFSDLSVRWHGINPVVQIGRLTSDHLQVAGITAELNTLGSFWHNTYVFRTFRINSVSLLIAENTACELELPTVVGNSIGLTDFLRFTNNIDISFKSSITCGPTNFEYEGFLRTVRHDNVYRLHASVRDLGECEMCSMSVLYEVSKTGFWRSKEERLLNAQAHDFIVPTHLFGWNFVQESLVNAQILMSGTASAASLIGSIEFQPLGESLTRPKLSLDVGVELAGNNPVGKITATLMDDDERVLSTLEHIVRQDKESGYFHGWSQNIALDSIGALMSTFGSEGHPIYRWVSALTPTGNLTKLQWILDPSGFTYGAGVTDLRLQQHSGFPNLTLDSIHITGRGSVIQVFADAREYAIDDSNFLAAPLALTSLESSGTATWSQHYFGCSLEGQWIPSASAETVDLNFDYRVNSPFQQQWFHLSFNTPRVSARQLLPYVASFAPEHTFDWIEQSIHKVYFEDASVELVRNVDGTGLPYTTFEVRAPFLDAQVMFYQDWPLLEQGSGELQLTKDALLIQVESAYTQGNHIEQGTISLPFSEPLLAIEFTADSTFLLLQSYLVESPLVKQIPIDPMHFDGSGSIDIAASLKIPLREKLNNLWDVKLQAVLSDVLLDAKPANTQLDDLNGTLSYEFPNQLTSKELTGSFFDEPVALELRTRNSGASHDEAVITFELTTSVSAISHITGDWLHGLAAGSTDVNGEIIFPFSSDTKPAINLYSNLTGIEISLPKPFYKPAAQSRPLFVGITRDETTSVAVSMDPLRVQATVVPGSTWRGSVGLNVAPQAVTPSSRNWVVAGSLKELVFATDVISNTTIPPSLDIEFDNLYVEKLVRGQFQLHELKLDGTFGGLNSDLAIQAQEGRATLSRVQGEDWQLNVEQLRLWYSSFDSPNDIALDPTVFLRLPSVDVSVQELYLFDENGEAEEFGSWNFALDTNESSVLLRNIVADFRGVNLDTRENTGIVWDTNKNETRFGGVIKGGNLIEVLPKFDVDAEVESRNFTVNTNLVWPGSPFDVDLLRMRGRIHGDAKEGTLLEVEAGQGILRLLGVFNIAPIIQRMDFNPAVMFAKGFNFDRILYDVTLEESQLIIKKPIHIKGRSSEIRFTGSANLVDESLTMDVVVKLPFSSNLKWYVALITGNPTAFLGTMIGSRIFQPQLDRISSAKYKVAGTFETPEVELIGVFKDDLTDEATDDNTTTQE